MEFGRLDEKTLETINFKLPADPTMNAAVLKGKPAKGLQVYVGCAKWGRPEWVGKIYPLKTKEKDYLSHYVNHYNSIELNATHYKLYSEEIIKKWNDNADGKDFKFCPKMYKGVTHYGTLKDKQFLTDEFFKNISGFGKHLGPTFIQVSESFSPKRKDELFAYLLTLPKDMDFFIEVRHADWFSDGSSGNELFSLLKKLKLGAVITDTAGRRDCAHMHITIPKTFIRFVGNSLHKTDFTRIDEWTERLKTWVDNGLKEAYFFMHMHDEATSPELTVYLADKLNTIKGIDIQKPVFTTKQNSLF